NLNIPRYIDSQEAEDNQDIDGHLHGGIPTRDVDALDLYWSICPKLRRALFEPLRTGYFQLALDKGAIKSTIYDHPEFTRFIGGMETLFAEWRNRNVGSLKALKPGFHPKSLIASLGENLLAHYSGKPLID